MAVVEGWNLSLVSENKGDSAGQFPVWLFLWVLGDLSDEPIHPAARRPEARQGLALHFYIPASSIQVSGFQNISQGALRKGLSRAHRYFTGLRYLRLVWPFGPRDIKKWRMDERVRPSRASAAAHRRRSDL